jgi:TolB-like protein/Flp pilus assembly protein TadD
MTDAQADPKVEIGHVLIMDVVEYSALLITEQSRIMSELKRIVRSTARFQKAQAEDKLVCVPTGDGMLLVFFNDPEAPIECAMEISAAVKNHPEIRLRMGIHSGPVNQVLDVNEQANATGAGIDMAQRVMDCGDAGHILLSKRVADDLAPFPRWNPHLHDLGECEVKHARRISLVNFYTAEVGNAELPRKCQVAAGGPPGHKLAVLVSVASIIGLILGLMLFWMVGTSRWDLHGLGSRRAASLPAKSIAVLPFENLSGDPENAYFADGIQEEILTRLSKIGELKVISRTSTQRYKSAPKNLSDIANQLGVANILEGSVQRAADQVRVNVQLINAGDDSHIWADKFDRKLIDIFAVESEIATKIAEALQAKLTGFEQKAITNRPTENREAHEFYLRGRYYWHKKTAEDLARAIDYFRQAIGRDPDYALAYAGLSDAYAALPLNTDTSSYEAMPKAKAAALKTIELDNTLADGHAALAIPKAFYDWDWSGAEHEFQNAIRLNPNEGSYHHRYGMMLSAVGRNEEAIAELKHARELDPLSLIIGTALAVCLDHARKYDEGIAACRKVFEIDPNFWVAHHFLGGLYEQEGFHEKALEELKKARNFPRAPAEPLSVAGYVYAVSGRKPEALKVLEELKQSARKRYIPPYHLAMVYVGLGDKEHAFEMLEQSYQNRDDVLGFGIKSEPRWDGLRSDPRYLALLQRMHLIP